MRFAIVMLLLVYATSANAQLTLGDAKRDVLMQFIPMAERVDSLMQVKDMEFTFPNYKTLEGDVLRVSTFMAYFDSTDRLARWSESTIVDGKRFREIMEPMTEDKRLHTLVANNVMFAGRYEGDGYYQDITYVYETQELKLRYFKDE